MAEVKTVLVAEFGIRFTRQEQREGVGPRDRGERRA